MDVILLERVAKLGQMGEVVRVRDGYARNFLLPQGKALRSTAENLKRFESQRAQLEARNLERKSEAQGVADKLAGKSFIAVRQAGETGQLYGSVTARDLADLLEAGGFSVGRSQVQLNQPIKSIGLHPVMIALHPEVETEVTVNVARSEDEAERQAAGEDLSQPFDDFEDEEEEEAAAEGEETLEASAEGEEASTDEAEEADAETGEDDDTANA